MKMKDAQDKAIEEILTYLKTIETLRSSHPYAGFTSPETFMLRHGKPWRMNDKTFDGERGEVHGCYMNAYRLMDSNSKMTYVEGYVNLGGLPIQHAWCVDKNGNVIDPTLTAPVPGKTIVPIGYFGIPFNRNYVYATAVKTGVYGVLSGMSNWELFEGKVKPATFRSRRKSCIE